MRLLLALSAVSMVMAVPAAAGVAFPDTISVPSGSYPEGVTIGHVTHETPPSLTDRPEVPAWE